MARRRVRRGGTPIARRDPHLLQQRGDMEAAHLLACLPEQGAQPPAAGKGILQVQRIKLTHQGHIGGSGGGALVVDAASTQPKQLGLTADTQPVRTVDPRLALGRRPALLSAPSQQSFARVSCPIFACRAVTSISDTAACFTRRRRPLARLPAVAPSTA